MSIEKKRFLAWATAAGEAVRRKIDRHLLPLMCFLYGLNYVDKVAMGWAVLFDFRADLKLVGDQYSWASSMFYFGYLAAQYPTNYILQRYRTAKILSCTVLAWGVLMLAHLGLHNFTGLIIVRFLLGVAESVVTPGFVLYTSGTFSIISSLLSFGLGHITNTALKPWMYIFLVLGLLSMLCGVGGLIFMPKTPNKAKFLTQEEQVIAVQRVAQNMMGIKVKDPKTWFLLTFILFTQLPNGGLTSFGSLVISGFGFNKFKTLLIGLPSSVVSAGSMIIPLLPAIAGMAAVYATNNTGANKYGRVFAYWLINSYAVTWPFCLTIIRQNVAGHTKRAFTNTMLFIVFAAGNIAGPFFFCSEDAPKYVLAIASILVFFCATLVCTIALRYYMIWENNRRDAHYGKVETVEDLTDGMRIGMHDKTDLENVDFRYVL
ncbi:MFS general substrate transporter [Bimuria novae-zelandiae CBS 107.79]|uniref:MFS general substrate transporter n=1 Tax=Bimuria novae-zelandiae CBS 107.79 TaxID=1447943 RepID=A0A6A5VHG1_9PLEO|nr:MFS general substrate transporter [Bimuria novae-zelandiae CBS 107.79]